MQFSEEQYSSVLNKCFADNKGMRPLFISLSGLISKEKEVKYAGCVYGRDGNNEPMCVNINNSANRTMFYYPLTKRIEYSRNCIDANYSYTGGVYYGKDKCVYGFPRNSTGLLKIDPNEKTIEEISLGLEEYDFKKNMAFGRHYGGVLSGKSMISPPRASDYVLIINLDDYSVQKIHSAVFEKNKFSSAVLHPNGKVYFSPMRGSRVVEFDPETHELQTIGEPVYGSIFGGTVYSDLCIYGFSQTGIGLYRIDVKNRKVEVVVEKINGKEVNNSYGTFTHFNGKIYNIPGNTRYLFEYDPETGNSRICQEFDDGRFNFAKWAGGSLLPSGNIYLTPAFGRFAAEITFNKPANISQQMLNLMECGYFNGM